MTNKTPKVVLGCPEASIGGLGCTWAALEAYVGDLGPLLGLYGRSWAALGVYVGGPGPLLGPMLAVLGRSCALCWWSWAALGAYVVEKREEHGYPENVLSSRAGARSTASGAVLGRSWTLCWRSWATLGADIGDPGPLLESRLAVLGRLRA